MAIDSTRWKVPGFYSSDEALLRFLWMTEASNLPSFTEVYGTMPCKWDGGRTIRAPLSSNPSPPNFEQYHQKGIQVCLTFNSNQLTEEDLEDEVANRLLQDADGAIVASRLLNNYIRDKYPKISRTASTILSIIPHKNKTLDHYRKLCDEYDKVVVGTTHLFNSDQQRSLDLKFIDQLDRDKIEIMVNDNCVFDCPHRTKHHTLVARHNKMPTSESSQEVIQFFQSYCRSHLAVKGMATDLILTNSMVDTLKNMGFERFKLVGRDLPEAYLLTEMVRYIIPERLQPHISMSLSHILHSVAISSFIPLLQSHINTALAMASQPPAPESQKQVITLFVPVLQSYINKALALARRPPTVPDIQ
jgi:hypothetical protein